MGRPKILHKYMSSIIDGSKRVKKWCQKSQNFEVFFFFDKTRTFQGLFWANPKTTNVWPPVWQKKYCKKPRRGRTAASWTSEVKIFNFWPLQGRYIKKWFFYDFWHEKTLVVPNHTPQTQQKSQILNKKPENCIFGNFQKKKIFLAFPH